MQMIIFDTETSGFSPNSRNIVQLSYLVDNGELSGKNFYFAVDNVDEGAAAVHGLTVDKLAELSEGYRFYDVVEEVLADFGAAKLLIAHNIKFDLSFLTAEVGRCGFSLTEVLKRDRKMVDTVCTMHSTTNFCKLPGKYGYKGPKLNELMDCLGIEISEVEEFCRQVFGDFEGFHDARFDVAGTYMAYKMASEQGIMGGVANGR